MNKLPRKFASFGIGKVTSEVLLCKTAADSYGNRSLDAQISADISRGAQSQTVIDNWLQNAKGATDYSMNGKAVKLHLPVVLKTLQRLRSTDNRAPYFALISKIQSSKITWLNSTNRPIHTRGALPIEFFHEVSSMIYRLSMAYNADELRLLSRFILKLLHSYNRLLETKDKSDLKLSAKFFRNCLMPIARTESVLLIIEALKHLPPGQENLKYLLELAFYYHSSQSAKVLSQLNVLCCGKINLSQDEMDAFFPLFFSIMQSLVIHGDEEICTRLIVKFSKDWAYQMDPHYHSVLSELCEKYAADRVLHALGVTSPTLQWKALRSQLTWGESMTCLSGMNIDLFQEDQDLDFLQEKLNVVGPHVADWKHFLNSGAIPCEANPSLKSFALNTILMHMVAHKRTTFLITILEHLIYEMGYSQQLFDSGRLLSVSHYSGFHCLFKAFSTKNPAILASYTLFKFLKTNKQIPFEFSTLDFYCMMKACLAGADHHPIYYFVFQYIKTMGASLYVESQGEESWALPPNIEQLLIHKVARKRGDEKILEIINQCKNWFLQHKSEDMTIDLVFLQQAFGDKYVPNLTVASMITLEQKHNHQDPLPGDELYSPAADLRLNQRLRRLLKFIADNTNSMHL